MIIVLRGLPGSGKSSYAATLKAADPENTVVVNRDELRIRLFGKYSGLTREEEDAITKAEVFLVKQGLEFGKTVVIDAMHLKRKYAKKWFAFSDDVQFVDFEATLSALYHRNDYRDKKVPETVIADLYKRFTKNGKLPEAPTREEWESEKKPGGTFEKFNNDGTVPVYIVDIDGTLAHNDGHRGWHDYDRVGGDKPHQDVIELVKVLNSKWDVVFFSGRKEYCRKVTNDWLDDHLIPKGLGLYMRADDDNRNDDIVKYEMLQQFKADHPWSYIAGAIDDRPRILRMWHEIGITTFRVGDPCGEDF